ncbi:hypothetical protein GCM10023081_30650 [Arthrobacter ginkgonis]|uniref:FMN-binding domain-containing protein n=1 Tax=Arthrobacter ginkgonis TaxID=1630594 RepID=A0ABP7CI49_9MICC
MRIRSAIFAVLASAGVLVSGWYSGVLAAGAATSGQALAAGASDTSDSATGSGRSGSSGSSGTSGTSGSSGSSTDSGSSGSDATVTGDAYSTRWGDVQVRITVEGGEITDVEAVELPERDGHSQRISQVAEPVLREEVLSSQSTDVQLVGGATYTSRAYLDSLQSAIDKANL